MPRALFCRRSPPAQELDLSASDVEKEGAMAIVAALETNKVLSKLSLSFNPGLGDAEKAALRAAAEKRVPPIVIDL